VTILLAAIAAVYGRIDAAVDRINHALGGKR